MRGRIVDVKATDEFIAESEDGTRYAVVERTTYRVYPTLKSPGSPVPTTKDYIAYTAGHQMLHVNKISDEEFEILGADVIARRVTPPD